MFLASPITFPNLGIEINPSPVAFTVFGKDIYWYGIISWVAADSLRVSEKNGASCGRPESSTRLESCEFAEVFRKTGAFCAGRCDVRRLVSRRNRASRGS